MADRESAVERGQIGFGKRHTSSGCEIDESLARKRGGLIGRLIVDRGSPVPFRRYHNGRGSFDRSRMHSLRVR